MSSNKEHIPKGAHSQEKLRIYYEYLSAYLIILLQKFNHVNVYDMMAGEAFYEDKDGKKFKGSAVLAFEVIKKCKDMKEFRGDPAKEIHLYLNDIKSKKYESLQDYKIKQNVDWVHCHNKDVNTAILERLAQTRADKNLFYLDPFGIKQIKKSSIDAIVRKKNNECLWFFPVTHMARFIKEDVAAITKFCDDYGISIAEHSNVKWHEWGKIMKDAFKRSYPKSYVGMAKLEKTKGPNYYALYFIGNNALGLQRFIEVVKRIDSLQMELFLPSDSEMMSYLSESPTKTRTNCELYEHILKEGWLNSSSLSLLKTMEEDGKIKVFPEEGVRRKKGAFYLSHKAKVEIRVQAIKTLF